MKELFGNRFRAASRHDDDDVPKNRLLEEQSNLKFLSQVFADPLRVAQQDFRLRKLLRASFFKRSVL